MGSWNASDSQPLALTCSRALLKMNSTGAGFDARIQRLRFEKDAMGTSNRFADSCFWQAIDNGIESTALAALAAGADPNGSDAEGGRSALMAAAEMAMPKLCEALAAAGADVEACDAAGRRAAHYACMGSPRSLRCALLLMALGADFTGLGTAAATPAASCPDEESRSMIWAAIDQKALKAMEMDHWAPSKQKIL